MKRFAVSQELFQALLTHYWLVKSKAPKTALIYPKGYCISYGDLIRAAKVPLNPQHAGGPLYEIASFCCERYDVPLHALVVNAETGVPGPGFLEAPCSTNDPSYNGWAEIDVPKCINAENLPKVAPALP